MVQDGGERGHEGIIDEFRRLACADVQILEENRGRTTKAPKLRGRFAAVSGVSGPICKLP